MKSIKFYFINAGISILITLGILFLYDTYYKQEIMVIDIGEYLLKQKEKYLSGELTDDELEVQLQAIQKKIDDVPKRYVLLRNDVVVKRGNAEKIQLLEKEVSNETKSSEIKK